MGADGHPSALVASRSLTVVPASRGFPVLRRFREIRRLSPADPIEHNRFTPFPINSEKLKELFGCDAGQHAMMSHGRQPHARDAATLRTVRRASATGTA